MYTKYSGLECYILLCWLYVGYQYALSLSCNLMRASIIMNKMDSILGLFTWAIIVVSLHSVIPSKRFICMFLCKMFILLLIINNSKFNGEAIPKYLYKRTCLLVIDTRVLIQTEREKLNFLMNHMDCFQVLINFISYNNYVTFVSTNLQLHVIREHYIYI